MASPDFALEIVEQHWLAGLDERLDLCSHGTVGVQIGGVLVTGNANSWDDAGISRAALALLRTLDQDHESSANDPESAKLIPHSCGFLSIPTSCPSGIDWSVRHIDGMVTLDSVTTEPGIGQSSVVDTQATIPWSVYRDAVITFAQQAVRFVEGSPKKTPDDDWDRQDFEHWHTETIERIERFARADPPSASA